MMSIQQRKAPKKSVKFRKTNPMNCMENLLVQIRKDEDSSGGESSINSDINILCGHVKTHAPTLQTLKRITGYDNLEDVGLLEIMLDFKTLPIQNFGSLMPCLTQLNITKSTLDSLRDIGTGFSCLKELIVCSCHLRRLDGASSFPNLEDLNASYNKIIDPIPCATMPKLQCLNLRNNRVEDINLVEFLGLCETLKSLNLKNSPVVPATEKEMLIYRETIEAAIPQLEFLDGLTTRSASEHPSILSVKTSLLASTISDQSHTASIASLAQGPLLRCSSPGKIMSTEHILPPIAASCANLTDGEKLGLEEYDDSISDDQLSTTTTIELFKPVLPPISSEKCATASVCVTPKPSTSTRRLNPYTVNPASDGIEELSKFADYFESDSEPED